MLHSDYIMELFRLESKKLVLENNNYYDHFSFDIYFSDLTFSDLTNWPYTINPKDFFKNPTHF